MTPLISRLDAVKALILAHVEALTFEVTINGVDLTFAANTDRRVVCKDGYTDNTTADPFVTVSWPVATAEQWAGSGNTGIDIYMPQFWIASRNANLAEVVRELIRDLWLPGSSNYNALSAAHVEMMLPRDHFPANLQGGTLEQALVGQYFELHIQWG